MWQAMLGPLEGGGKPKCHFVGTTEESFTEKKDFIPSPAKRIKLECMGGSGLFSKWGFLCTILQKAMRGGTSLETQHFGDRWEHHCKFKACLIYRTRSWANEGYTVKLCLKNTNQGL